LVDAGDERALAAFCRTAALTERGLSSGAVEFDGVGVEPEVVFEDGSCRDISL